MDNARQLLEKLLASASSYTLCVSFWSTRARYVELEGVQQLTAEAKAWMGTAESHKTVATSLYTMLDHLLQQCFATGGFHWFDHRPVCSVVDEKLKEDRRGNWSAAAARWRVF
ncbi:unnamed protein product [Urochloa humidicola]